MSKLNIVHDTDMSQLCCINNLNDHPIKTINTITVRQTKKM
jgi:hypothetical protein